MIPENLPQTLPLFQADIIKCVDPNHPLIVLAKEIDWSVFDRAFKEFYSDTMGAPAKIIRLLVGLHYLKHAFSESDESVVERWVENPYWQYFCGFEVFQTKMPLDPSNLVQWRQRVGPKGIELLLKETIEAAKRKGLIKPGDASKVNVDTTVQEKNITYPTDAKLCHKMREVLVREAKKRKIKLRQSYARVSKRALVMQGRYRHAKKGKKAAREVRKIKRYLTRVVRDVIRKMDPRDEPLKDQLFLASHLLLQQKDSKDKIYSIHEPHVECISKGKVHKLYEFGCKVGIVSSSRRNWVLGIHAFHGRPYDGHTLTESLSQAEQMTGIGIKRAYVDRGYRGHDYAGPTQVHVAGTDRGRLTRTERRARRRRSAVEPVIGHTKHDNRMDRNFLRGVNGDKANAVLAASGFNMRKLMAEVRRLFLRLFFYLLFPMRWRENRSWTAA